MDRLNSITKQFGLELSDKQIEQFSKYYDILVEWNKVMNLTAITEKEDVIIKHFADSLLLSKYKDLHENIDVIDVGTGAGFPGIPLKIAFPELNITLMDSLNKRLKFLDEVIDELGLQDIHTVHSRAEDGGREEMHREKYDLAVSRAVANLATLSEWCIPFVKPGGYFVSYKSNAFLGYLLFVFAIFFTNTKLLWLLVSGIFVLNMFSTCPPRILIAFFPSRISSGKAFDL